MQLEVGWVGETIIITFEEVALAKSGGTSRKYRKDLIYRAEKRPKLDLAERKRETFLC